MEVIDGNRIAAELIAELKAEVAAIKGRKPCIALVRVGEDPASVSYVRKKGQTAAEIGIESRVLLPPADIAQAALETLVDNLNADPGVDGILVQSPLPGAARRARDLRADRPGQGRRRPQPGEPGQGGPGGRQRLRRLHARRGSWSSSREAAWPSRASMSSSSAARSSSESRRRSSPCSKKGRGQRDRHRLPFPDGGPAGDHPPGRRPDRRHRAAGIRHGGHGQARARSSSTSG